MVGLRIQVSRHSPKKKRGISLLDLCGTRLELIEGMNFLINLVGKYFRKQF